MKDVYYRWDDAIQHEISQAKNKKKKVGGQVKYHENNTQINRKGLK